jgi:DNA-binding MarR family transcriptional regulator
MHSSILAAVQHFRRYYTQLFLPLGAQYDLSQLEMDVLLFLHNNPGHNTARDIVELRGFAKSNVSTAIETLRARGYLTVAPDAHSRRVHRLYLTPDRRPVAAELAACQQDGLARLLTGFTPEERAQLWQLLSRIDGNLTAALRQEG